MDLALFDFDGTITTREVFPDFMYLAVSWPRLTVGKVLLAPLIVGYRLGWVSGSTVRAAIVRFGFSGTSLQSLQTHGTVFAETFLPGVIRPGALERIAWHKARGDTVVVVSGALDVYLDHWCKAHDLELICSALEHRDGRLTGRYLGAQCVRREKARLVRERYDLSAYSRIHAYGDTPEDHELLAIAHERYYRWQLMAGPPHAVP